MGKRKVEIIESETKREHSVDWYFMIESFALLFNLLILLLWEWRHILLPINCISIMSVMNTILFFNENLFMWWFNVVYLGYQPFLLETFLCTSTFIAFLDGHKALSFKWSIRELSFWSNGLLLWAFCSHQPTNPNSWSIERKNRFAWYDSCLTYVIPIDFPQLYRKVSYEKLFIIGIKWHKTGGIPNMFLPASL